MHILTSQHIIHQFLEELSSVEDVITCLSCSGVQYRIPFLVLMVLLKDIQLLLMILLTVKIFDVLFGVQQFMMLQLHLSDTATCCAYRIDKDYIVVL